MSLTLPTDTDIDDTTWRVSINPNLPVGTRIGDLTGTAKDLALGATRAIRAALNECSARGDYALATYNFDQGAGAVTKTSLVKDFVYNGGPKKKRQEPIVCGIQVAEESSS